VNKEMKPKLKTRPADFSVLLSGIFTIAREMGLNMERTARAPVYFSAHDFVTGMLTLDGEILALAEYIPVLIGSTPFAVRAVKEYYQDDIHEGDVFLLNDPYILDGGNHLADWCIIYPVYRQGKHVLWIANKAHQQDTGGGAPGGYNPNAIDVYAEGLRIPPIKVYEKGRERSDVVHLIMSNVRIPGSQRGDMLALIGAARVGEKRLRNLYDSYGEAAINIFIEDFMNYGEDMMRREIEKIPPGSYRGKIHGKEGSSPIVCNLTVKGSEMTIDFSESGPMSQQYINSPIANTYSCIYMALLTSIGKKTHYHCGGCYRPIKIVTKPGTITHAVYPATEGGCTLIVAKQIIEAVWNALAEAIPEETPAGWGSNNAWAFSGIDPRRGEGYGTPDFLADSSGAGAIWGTDGWSANGPSICSGTLYKPEIEVCESLYPIQWERWEYLEDSGGPGKWRGGLGMINSWVVDAGAESVHVANAGDTNEYEVAPAIAGGKTPTPNSKTIMLANGMEKTYDDVRRDKIYQLHTGDKVIDHTGGGAGVGDPIERDVESVLSDVKNELVSVESAKNIYGVIIDPKLMRVDSELTVKLRAAKKLEKAVPGQ